MRDYVDIGPSPSAEPCVSVGELNYTERAREECRRFIVAIRETIGPEPAGARLAIKSNPHDFGSYLEVVCYYDTDDADAEEYAFKCESDAPEHWTPTTRYHA